MRTVPILTLGASCFLAAAATVQGPQQGPGKGQGMTHPKVGQAPPATPGRDDPVFRVDCDDWATVRPDNMEIWDKMTEADMSLEQAIDAAVRYAKEDQGYENVRVRMAQFIPSDRPFFEIELFTWKEDKDVALRWQVFVGVRTKGVKLWMIQERFPGTPVRGEIITKDSGLMIHDVRAGDGPMVEPDSTVKVNYVGTILDGTLVFDTYAAMRPDTFTLPNAPVKGMAEGLIGAREGGKRKLILPPDLAYGEGGYPGFVPPNATVVFDIEILEVR